MTTTTTDEYEHNKQRRYYIRRQTTTKNDVKAESQPIPNITEQLAQKFITKKETNLNTMLKEDMKCARLNKHDKLEEYQHVINAIKTTYGINEYQTDLLEKDNDNDLLLTLKKISTTNCKITNLC